MKKDYNTGIRNKGDNSERLYLATQNVGVYLSYINMTYDHLVLHKHTYDRDDITSFCKFHSKRVHEWNVKKPICS